MSYQRFVTEDRRLAILRILSEDTDYTVNDSILSTVLTTFGHDVPRDTLRADLAWLAEQELVTVDPIRDGRIYVARLSGRGLDVAQGRAVVPGVKRPRPE